MLDSAIVRAHQQAASGKEPVPRLSVTARDQALGRCRGGLTTKVHMLADALGRPLRPIIAAGQVGDITEAPALLHDQAGDAALADKAYDSDALRAVIATMGAEAVISSNRSRKRIIPHDTSAYRHRKRIERRFATRYDRRTIHFVGFVHLTTTMIWLR